MAYGQTLMVLLAIVLFSTMMLGYYNNLFRWHDVHNREYARFQALKIADGVFQHIEFQYISDLFTIEELLQAWSNYDNVITFEDIDYNIFVESTWSDSSGVDSGSDSGFLRFDLRIGCNPGYNDTIWVGTQAEPLQKMIADMGI